MGFGTTGFSFMDPIKDCQNRKKERGLLMFF